MRTVARPSVLLIEPHDDTRSMYTEYLVLSGFHVVASATEEDLVSRARDADIVITGLHIGAVDGLDVIRRVQQEDATKQKVLVVLTACAFPADRERAQAAGCDLLLVKPCLPETLATELRRALALRSRVA